MKTAGEQGSQYDGKYDDVPWLQILGMFHQAGGDTEETKSDVSGGDLGQPMFNLFDQSNLFI